MSVIDDDEDRVDGRELTPLDEDGSDDRLSADALARMSAPEPEPEADPTAIEPETEGGDTAA